MTAFAINSGGIEYYDQKTGGSTNATLDTYTISNGSALVVRTDTYACLNHSTAFGSLDNVSYSGIGGEVVIDPTYTRHVAFTGGSGNSPAFGAAISQGGVSGVFLGVWADWQSEPIVPGAAIPATGFIKIGGVVGGSFSAGALTGIVAVCSGADVQSWIEVRGADTAAITVPRVGKFSSAEAWFEIGTTNGSRGQVVPCPTTATNAGVFPGVWIETSAGSGVYDKYNGVGSQVPTAATRTDASCKFIWSTTSGVRLGSDGTNSVGYLPPSGCKIRIPAIILTNVTRSAGGSGPRVLPNSTLATRCEFVTTAAGSVELRGVVCQWFINLVQSYSVVIDSCAINDTVRLSEIPTQVLISDCVLSPTQSQSATMLQISSCFAGLDIADSSLWRFNILSGGSDGSTIDFSSSLNFSNVIFGCLTLRTSSSSSLLTLSFCQNVVFDGCTIVGARIKNLSVSGGEFLDTNYFDHTLTTATSSAQPQCVYELSEGCTDNKVNNILLPLPEVGPYVALVVAYGTLGTEVMGVGSYATPLALNSSVTGGAITTSFSGASGNNTNLKLSRVYLSSARIGIYSFNNADTDVVVENSCGGYSDVSVVAALNAKIKGCGLVGATTGQTAVYGSHWQDHFTSATAGVLEITCNEPTIISAAQCAIISGSPKFNATGSVLMTVVGQQIIWEMPYFALGHTALANSALSLTGTNTGNLSYEFQYDIGAGYNGTWLIANATNFTGVGAIDPAVGIKIKLRVTCVTANASNALTNIRITTVTTSTAQSTNLYPLDTITLTLTGLVTGSDVVVRAAGTSTILASVDSNAGTTWAYVYETPVAIDVDIFKPGYVPKSLLRNYTPSAQDSSLPVSQLFDRNYL